LHRGASTRRKFSAIKLAPPSRAIGLKLQPEQVAVDTLVIDHINPEPTPN
jgi:uncharacterized protein (TIGR03435 family)